jgi:exopolyphosphatase / guanosine-5'-triphosphate,3'-diphosphate pyrophosphatase
MRRAVLDLGSNSFHLLVADVGEEGSSAIVPVRRAREMLHLGRAVMRHGHIPTDLAERAVTTTERLADLARRAGAEVLTAVATEALRAPGGSELLASLSEAAGVPVELLDGHEEAALAYLGARASVGIDTEPVAVIDLGGGSLELAVGSGHRLTWATSLPLGASRLSATPGISDAPDGLPDPTALAALRRSIDRALAPAAHAVAEHRPSAVVAVGGVVRAIVRLLAVQEERWMPSTVNRATLPASDIGELAAELLEMDDAGRAEVAGLSRQRADHLHIGALVLARTLRALGTTSVTVSDWGLREGVLLDRSGRDRVPDAATLRAAEVARLRRSFGGDDAHPEFVAGLAGRLFDRTVDLHGLDASARGLLVAAAELHAVGASLALRRQHEHGAYIVEHAELRGFDPAELAAVVTLVRFHPSRGVSRRYPPFRSLPSRSREGVLWLLALLQLADALDAAHDQRTVVRAVRRSAEGLVLDVAGPVGPVVERAVRDRSALASEVLGLPVTLRVRPAA